MVVSFILSALIAVFTTASCIYLLKPIAVHIGLLDTPGGRKTHASAVPLIGGISIFFGFCFSILFFNMSMQSYRGLLAGSAILVLLGVMDDFHELTPRIRLIGQCLAALLLIEWGHHSINHLGNLFFLGNISLGVFSLVFTIIFVLGFINAINMIDGHDGLAGSIIFGQAAFLALFNFELGQNQNMYLLLLFMLALFVFLIFNFPASKRKRATIFMGDAGSTFIGFVIAWFAVDLLQVMFTHHQTHLNPITVFWVLSYPLYDLLAVILHRLSSRRSPFVASRDHLHYLLLDLGFNRLTVTLLLFLFSILLGSFGILLAKEKVVEAWQLVFFLSLFFVHFITTVLLQKRLNTLAVN
jgi:UDP-GlcNAc:undecaprenyl-phosphate GlcNAc-1-phosphate transferase